MKDLMILWHTLSGHAYSRTNTINPDSNRDTLNEQDEAKTQPSIASFRRKSSLVVNRFLNVAVPINADGSHKWPRNIFILMTLGLLGIASGCFVLIVQPYDMLFKWKIILGEGGEIFEIWRKPEVNVILKIYLFNITNHVEYLEGRQSKLKIQETGPYVYKEFIEHGNIVFNNNGTLTTKPLHPLKYLPELSNGTEDDLLILPNIALLSITNVMKDASYISRWGLNTIIRQTNSFPLVPMTAHEFMFGYESTLVTLGNKLMPSWIKFDKLGLIDRMYDFDGDFETVFTGATDKRMSGQIDKYRGSVDLPQWTGKCANVHGASDGTKFASFIQPNDTLKFYRKSLCRSIKMVRNGEDTIKGLQVYHYKFMENEMDNGVVNPENKCFCRLGHCLQSGLIDVTDCYYGFPIALSFPHFYKTDPSLMESIEGMNPKKELHESFFYIQPRSGLPVKLAFRFQINMVLQDITHMANVEKLSNKVLPLLWFEIGINELPDNLNMRFWFYLNFLPIGQDVVMYVLFLFGVLALIWSVAKIMSYQEKGSSVNWLEKEMSRRRQRAEKDKESDGRSREMDTYSSLLLPDDTNLVPTMV